MTPRHLHHPSTPRITFPLLPRTSWTPITPITGCDGRSVPGLSQGGSDRALSDLLPRSVLFVSRTRRRRGVQTVMGLVPTGPTTPGGYHNPQGVPYPPRGTYYPHGVPVHPGVHGVPTPVHGVHHPGTGSTPPWVHPTPYTPMSPVPIHP